jgi:hypothetical protein
MVVVEMVVAVMRTLITRPLLQLQNHQLILNHQLIPIYHLLALLGRSGDTNSNPTSNRSNNTNNSDIQTQAEQARIQAEVALKGVVDNILFMSLAFMLSWLMGDPYAHYAN